LPKGIKLLSVEYVRSIAEIKTTNYAYPVWHSVQWKEAGAEDVIYHMNGEISESSRSNIFIIKDGQVSTPNKHVLHGITRKHVMDIVGEVAIRPINFEEMLEADEVFITSTTKVLLPVNQVDNRVIGNGKVGKRTLDILEKFKALEKELCY
jgi:branched-chain amino acid aminotransferase